MSTLAAAAVIGAAAAVPSPRPFVDLFAAVAVAGAVAAAIVGSGAAWTDREAVLWGAAAAMMVVALAAAATVGFVFAPAAAFLLGAALLSGTLGAPVDGRGRST
ncbi:hypothetical protein ACFQFH_12450 [Halobaculum halobium]|uniref:Uncharacterized protein n=1 Tax=Halobaculum halobium TaxID=3032281 RepID=A0ABD5TB39_9EURY